MTPMTPENKSTRTVAAIGEAHNRKAAGLDMQHTLLEIVWEHGGINDPRGELKAREAEVEVWQGQENAQSGARGCDGWCARHIRQRQETRR